MMMNLKILIIIKIFKQEEEENYSEEQEEGMNVINIYNQNDFELDKVLNFFFNNNII